MNVEFDHATLVKWSPDSKAFIIQRYHENCVEVFKVEKKKENWLGPVTKVLTFSKVSVRYRIIPLAIYLWRDLLSIYRTTGRKVACIGNFYTNIC